MTGVQQVVGHARPHRAESDEADLHVRPFTGEVDGASVFIYKNHNTYVRITVGSRPRVVNALEVDCSVDIDGARPYRLWM
jgi:hypothetical protein